MCIRMKKIYILLIMSVMALHLSAKIPANSTIYLDVSQGWCCKATYAVCCSELSDAYFIMKPVAGIDGVYYYTTVEEIQDNFRFGYSNAKITTDGLGWSQFVTKDINGNYTAAKPYYIISDEAGNGSWAGQAKSSGTTQLDSIVVNTPFNCIDSTYNVVVSIYFSGAPCSIQLTGDQWATPYQTTTIKNPMIIKQEGFKENAGVHHNVSVSLYSDKAFTTEVSKLDKSYTSPDMECGAAVEYNLGEICIDSVYSLTAKVEGDVYVWTTGETTQTITITPTAGEQTDTVDIFQSVLVPELNLMANGDFESNPPMGFTSDYQYVGWNPNEYYGSHAGASNLYAITQNANYFWHDYASIAPHGGNYYALFDTGKKGYAWKATTTINPTLKIEKDSIYLFSYWAAHPNIPQYSNSPAILQFEIAYKDANGQIQRENLGDQYKLGQEEQLNGWYQQTVSWKAPSNSDYVEIAVKNLNNTEMGNDFALDDIMFQKSSVKNVVLSLREIYKYTGIDCSPEPPCTDNWLRAKWNDMLFINNSTGEFVRYQWFINGEAIDGATEQYYRAYTDLTNSQDLYHAQMWRADGSSATTCQKRFAEIKHSNTEFPYSNAAAIMEKRVHTIGAHFRIVEIIYEDGTVDAIKEIY